MDYRVLNPGEIESLRKLIPAERFFVGNAINPDYHRDELENYTAAPQAVVRPVSTEEVAGVVRFANENVIPIVVRGTATGLVGGAVPTHGGIVLDMTLMNRIYDLDPENLTVRAEAGVLLMDLAQYAQDHGFLYPPDPGEKSATIGGNISTNAGGMRAVRYGVTREYVLALTVVMPDGEVLQLGTPVVKTSSGLNLKELVIGSEGILCVVTEAVLKLIPRPAHSVSLLVPFNDIDAALDAVPHIITSNTNPTAIEFMERATIKYAEEFLRRSFPDSRSSSYLLLTFDGQTEEEVRNNWQTVADLMLERGASDVFILDSAERKHSVWSAREAFLLGIKASTTQMDECDVVVPRTRLGDFIRYTHEISERLQVRLPSFGHAGDGNLHVYICRDELGQEAWVDVVEEAFDLMYAKAKELGGQVSGEHGIGLAKRAYLVASVGEAQMRLMREIKRVFDPKGILNPGKVV